MKALLAAPSPQGPARAASGLRARDAYYLAHRAVQVLGTALLALGVTLRLSALEAGFFFTLASLLSAQVLLDAGSSTLLTTFMGRATPHLRWQAGRISGSAAALGRVAWLARFAFGWGAASGLAALLVLAPLANWLLAHRPEIEAVPQWPGITLATMCALGLCQLAAAVPAVLEGAGRVAMVARLRAAQDIVSYAAALACVAAGAGTWSLAVLWGCRGIIGAGWSLAALRQLGPALSTAPRVRWRYARAMWPMQWRLAGSWAAGWMAQQTIVPVAYALLGPATAGRLGLAFFFTNGLMLVSSAWVAARAPELSRLAALRQWPAFDALVARVQRLALASAVGGGVLLLLCAGALALLLPGLAPRLPALAWLAMLVAAAAVAVAVNTMATALRACADEPFLVQTLVVGALVLPALAGGASLAGAQGLCGAYLGLSAGLGLPWALRLFARFKRERTP